MDLVIHGALTNDHHCKGNKNHNGELCFHLLYSRLGSLFLASQRP